MNEVSRGAKHLIIAEAYSFQTTDMTKELITILLPDSSAVAVVHIPHSLYLFVSAHNSFWHFMFAKFKDSPLR